MNGNMIGKCSMLLKVHLSPKEGAREMEKRKKYERAQEKIRDTF